MTIDYSSIMEKTLYTSQPSWKVLINWLLFYCIIYWFVIGWVILAGSSLIFLVLGRYADVSWLALLLFIVVIIYAVLLRLTYKYTITNKGVYFKGGIIIRKQTFVPFTKITNVIITQHILEQILCISKIGLQTAGTGGLPRPEIVFEGIEDVATPRKIIYEFIEKNK